MTLAETIRIFRQSQFGKRKIIGYWKDENSFILNTKPTSAGFIEPCQYKIVNGKVIATNPLREKVMSKPMIKI